MWKPLSNLAAKADVIDIADYSPTLNLVSNYSTSSQTNLAVILGGSVYSVSSGISNSPVKVKKTIVK